jgi:pimeloyl-ACP methyl ester carboxylesterase
MMAPQWLRRSHNRTTVVFIHGILSNTENAWSNANGVFWPDLLCKEASIWNTGVYLFDYRADLFAGSFSLDDVVASMRDRFQLDDLWSQNQLIFVCHSMGGIIARRFIVKHEMKIKESNINIGLFLIASPSLGGNYANFIKNVARFYKNMQLDALQISQRNAWLNALDRDFLDLKDSGQLHIFGKELVEDNSIISGRFFRFRQIVPYFSAARYFGESSKIAGSDHTTIAKPDSTGALQHRLLVKFIKDHEKVLSQEPNPKPPRSKHRLEVKATRERDVVMLQPLSHKLLLIKPRTFEVSLYKETEVGVENVNVTLKIEKPYYIGESPITHGDWRQIVDGMEVDDARPKANTSFTEAKQFFDSINRSFDHTFSLPTEKEWIVAANQLQKLFTSRDRSLPNEINREWLTEPLPELSMPGHEAAQPGNGLIRTNLSAPRPYSLWKLRQIMPSSFRAEDLGFRIVCRDIR